MSLGPLTRNPLTPKTECKNVKNGKEIQKSIRLELHVVIILGTIVVPIRPFFGHLLSSGLFARCPNLPQPFDDSCDESSHFADFHGADARERNASAARRGCIQNVNAFPHFRHPHLSQIFEEPSDLVRLCEIIACRVK